MEHCITQPSNKGTREEALRGAARWQQRFEGKYIRIFPPISSTHDIQVGNDIEAAKKVIEDLKEAVKVAKDKQVAAQAEIKKLEKDMNEFKNNKEGKTEELRVREWLSEISSPSTCLQTNISKQKSAIQKHNVVMKTQQKEMQTVTLELGKLFIDCPRGFLIWK